MPDDHATRCEAALRVWGNSLSDDMEVEVMAWALMEIDALRARLAKLERDHAEQVTQAGQVDAGSGA